MVYFIVILTTFLLDQLTKTLVLQYFELYQVREVLPGFFNLTFVTNRGAAWSMLANVEGDWVHYFFVTLVLITVIGLTVVYMRVRKDSWLYGVALGFIVGGAIGNVIDRLRFGYVVDFLDFYIGTKHWPTFNVADSAICVGATLLVLMNFMETSRKDITEV